MTSPLNRSPAPNEGERRRDDALTMMECRDNRSRIIEHGRRVLLVRLLTGGTATIDHVQGAVELPAEIDPKCFGSAPGLLVRAGIIRAVGSARTSRPNAHARPVTVWELVDRVKAEAWLMIHPEPPALIAAVDASFSQSELFSQERGGDER